jgi:aspartyl/glutamyl-tRNA(Asn/Gln) amidotransferase C subunit
LDDVEPLEHLVENTENRFREDTAHESLDVTEALQNAPKHNDVFFKVPKVLGGGES